MKNLRSAASCAHFSRWAPQLLQTLRHPYTLTHARADILSGLTVATLAWPLSLGIAVAAGVPPERGLFTAIVGGFLAAAFGGGRFQISGPEGAFIALVATALAQHGLSGVVAATFLAGGILILAGAIGIGPVMRRLPQSVVLGFTSGVGLIVLLTQAPDFLGLSSLHPWPRDTLPKLGALMDALYTFSPSALGVGLITIGAIQILRRYRPQWPAMLIALILSSLCAAVLNLDVVTLSIRCGALPCQLPTPSLPDLHMALLPDILPTALGFALLGGMESLLCAVAGERATGIPHCPRTELIAQGIANCGAAFFGGICVTGAIARTMTNIRAGAYSPFAGMAHAVFLLCFLTILGPLAEKIPVPALAGMLILISYQMLNLNGLIRLWHTSKTDGMTALLTLGIAVFYNLIAAVLIGACIHTLSTRALRCPS